MTLQKHFCTICALSVGLLVVSGTTWWNKTWNGVVHDILASKMVVTPDNHEIIGFWEEPPITSTFDIYLWNVTNPIEVKKAAKPILEQVGPIRYRNVASRNNINFTDYNTVIYRNYMEFVFDESSPVGEDEVINALNMPFVVISGYLGKTPRIIRNLIIALMKNHNYEVFTKKTVKQLIWGYEDPVLAKMHSMFPSICPESNFGWFLGMNESFSLPFNIETGARSLGNWTYIKSWNGMEKLNIWENDVANSIMGTDGFTIPPGLEKGQDIDIFFDAACRSFKLEFNKIASKNTWIYKASPDTWKSVEEVPENQGFCVDGVCSKRGVLNMRKCTELLIGVQSPVFMSQPHFLDADPSFRSDIIGMRPTEVEHEFYFMEIDPLTGFMPQSYRRLQMNVAFDRSLLNTTLSNEILFPTVWFEHTVLPKKSLADEMIFGRRMIKIILNLPSILFIISLIGLLFSVPLLVKRTVSDNHQYASVVD